MESNGLRLFVLGLLAVCLAFGGCGSGSDGRDGVDGQDGHDGQDGEQGPPGPTVINASQVSDDFLEGLEYESAITSVEIASPPVVTFTLTTSTGVPITGIVPFWEASSRYVRFTMTKLVPGTGGEPNSWVAYTRDATTNAPDYDTGSSLVDNGDGSYTFTFNTDVTAVPGVPYEPTLTHRVAGQLGSRSVPIAPQNFFYDFIPAGGVITTTRNIAVMSTCNECHDNLVFHGRRFEVEYCVQCHNPDLTGGEGDMGYMIHRIHAGGAFPTLDGGIDYSHVTYPGNLQDCRKCHNGDDAVTPDGNNWRTVPTMQACGGCHDVFETNTHTGGPQSDNSACALCHTADQITEYHTTPNWTPNNPELLEFQLKIEYELLDASVDGTNMVTVSFRILSDGVPLDLTNLSTTDFTSRRPGMLLAYALPQDGILEPQDYNNFGRRGGQPISISLTNPPTLSGAPIGTLAFDAMTGVNTLTVTDPSAQFPLGATLRAVGLQGYLQQILLGVNTALHTPSAVVAVTGDDARREVIENTSCANCHEWFEGHGGNRTYDIAICTLCHTPNQSSSGRAVTDPTARGLDGDLADAIADGSLDPSVDPSNPLTYPEDAQNLKDLIHGIHSHEFRDRHFQHVRGPSRQGYYDWDHITFPRGASTSNCTLCHKPGTYALPLQPDLLPTTVRTTGVPDGMDPTVPDAENAFQGVPNAMDWINTPTASSCFYCHTSVDAMAHMIQNGASLSDPTGGFFTNRAPAYMSPPLESCAVCHGPGKTADVEAVHNR